MLCRTSNSFLFLQDRRYLSLAQARDKGQHIDWLSQPEPGNHSICPLEQQVFFGRKNKISELRISCGFCDCKMADFLQPRLQTLQSFGNMCSRSQIKTRDWLFPLAPCRSAKVPGHACVWRIWPEEAGGLHRLEALLWRVATEGEISQPRVPQNL